MFWKIVRHRLALASLTILGIHLLVLPAVMAWGQATATPSSATPFFGAAPSSAPSLAAPTAGIATPTAAPHWRAQVAPVHRRLTQRLDRLVRAQQQGELAIAARELDIPLQGDRVSVTVIAFPGRVTEAMSAISGAGGQVAGSITEYVWADIAVAALPVLAQHPDVRHVTPMQRAVSTAASEGDAAINVPL